MKRVTQSLMGSCMLYHCQALKEQHSLTSDSWQYIQTRLDLGEVWGLVYGNAPFACLFYVINLETLDEMFSCLQECFFLTPVKLDMPICSPRHFYYTKELRL